MGDNQFVMGIDIGGTSIKIGVVAYGSDIIWRRQLPFERIEPRAMLEKIAAVAAVAVDQYKISCVGISAAGKVDPVRGTTQADNLGWRDVPVRDIIGELLGTSVFIDNDAQCAMMSEWLNGACVGADNVVYLTYGTGIGGGIIVNGKPYRGKLNSGAELGHIITHANGRHCNCGHRGCYEVYASTTALKRMMGDRFSVKEIVDGAKKGDAGFLRVFTHYIEETAIGIASIMAVLSPDYVVLGGGLSNAGEFLLNRVRDRIMRYEPWLTQPTTIVLAKYGNDAGILGAAGMAQRHFLT